MSAGHADRLADVFVPGLEDSKRALADVLHRDAGQFLVAHREGDGQYAVRALLGTQAEVDQVVPIERGQQEGGRHARVAEERVRLRLGVEMRHLVFPQQSWYAVVRKRNLV